MKFKYLVIILALITVPVGASLAADIYPELGVDPFYSSFNPEYVDKNEFDVKDDTVVDFIKNKKESKSNELFVEQSDDFIEQPSVETIPDPFVDTSVKTTGKKAVKTKSSGRFINKIFKKKKKEPDFYSVHDEDDIPSYYVEEEEVDVKDSRSVFDDDEELRKNKKNKNRGADLVKELEKEEQEKQKALLGESEKKKFSIKELWPFAKNETVKEQKANVPNADGIEITAEHMQYYPERYEVEAVGNAKVDFKEQNVVLTATKIIFNYDRNILKASENVVLLSKGSVTEGDFIRIDLSKPEGIFENPITKTEDIILRAKEAYVYSDRIEEYDGVAKILKDEKLRFGSKSFAGYLGQDVFVSPQMQEKQEYADDGLYKIKANTIYIDSKDEHEVITIKNASLFFKNKKVATIPSAKIVSNKTNTNVETNLPEFGSKSGLGAHIGPAVVLNVPGGSTLKLAPVLTYADDDWGIGGIARFRSVNNMTEAAYGTSKDKFLLRGKHKLAPGLSLRYSHLTSQSEWFYGYRKPKYSATLNYNRTDYVKDLDLRFSQMFIGGVFVDKAPRKHLEDLEGRFRWMTQTHKPLYRYTNAEGNIGFSLGLVAQTAATVYTTGDVTGLFRVGPSLNTKVGPWKQTIVYYQTASAGYTPFAFDRYRYGRSNIVLLERLKICRYLSVGYLASMAMNRDVSSDKLFQESRITLSVGPDYAKVTIGYDAFRRNTMVLFHMIVGTKDSDVEFKKSVIQNPEKFGKSKSKAKKSKKKDYKKYLDENVEITPQ